jgi:hypothetical protein
MTRGKGTPTDWNRRYNKGDKVLGLEFGDHMGDW